MLDSSRQILLNRPQVGIPGLALKENSNAHGKDRVKKIESENRNSKIETRGSKVVRFSSFDFRPLLSWACAYYGYF